MIVRRDCDVDRPGEYVHATTAILGPSAGRDGLPAAPRGVVSGGGARPGGPSKCSGGDRTLAGWHAPARSPCVRSPRRSACERELRPARLARSGARPPPLHLLPGFAPVAHHLRHALLEPAALLLIARVLYRREITLHLTSFVAVHLL